MDSERFGKLCAESHQVLGGVNAAVQQYQTRTITEPAVADLSALAETTVPLAYCN
jgi:hypothetical protein